MLRHYQDLRDAGKRGFVFVPAHGWHIIDYIERFFVHIKGPLAGKPILLDPWQKFWTAVLYGWRRQSDGMRRFSRAYEEVARKNGKSTWKGPQGACSRASRWTRPVSSTRSVEAGAPWSGKS